MLVRLVPVTMMDTFSVSRGAVLWKNAHLDTNELLYNQMLANVAQPSNA